MGHAENEERASKKAKSANLPLKSALKKPKPTHPTKHAEEKHDVQEPILSQPRRSPINENLAKKTKAVRRAPTPPLTKTKAKVDKGKAKAAVAPEPKIYPSTFKVVVGTYEKLLYGLEGSFVGEDDTALERPSLKPIFIFPAHIACVKAVAASPDGGKWLATGSTDEIIKVWDLRRRKEIGGLIQHEGSITYLGFPTRSHLVSASEDGTLCIFRARDWVLLRSMKGHKGRVNCVAVHPSGKVGLSVGKDRTLRMWDLMRGKGSASTKLGKEGELVRWSTNGDRFVVQSSSTIDIYSVEMVLLHTFTHPKRVQDVRFYRSTSGKEYLLVAAEDKKVTFYNTTSTDSTSLPIVAEAIGHQNRVKAIAILGVATPHTAPERPWTTIMCTASSDGWIRIFDLIDLDSLDGTETGKDVKSLNAIAEYDTKGSRLTCCTLADGEIPVSGVTGKRKHGEDEDSDDDTKKANEGLDVEEEHVDDASDEDEDEEDAENEKS
ncbi:WD40 repeat-like protein [Fomitiporia mediterranea MF3/22]|uniref:WD40 repeat-like protein n=1 Tax=Fomitiporia mediterranea (strain MF3/22) TaxID=694068 RepID=UPI0004408943|nr:WD40 repeat-like protein [Fomitiporia mediterranea MF3/22]EJD07517.1 WD40 repeat-like protein [Fomitiporia mediterranea MF3/22]